MKRYFYYVRDFERVISSGNNKGKARRGNPVITVCLLLSENGDFTRGVAICSDMDQPNKVVGRSWAEQRALAGFIEKGDSELVKRKEAVDILIKTLKIARAWFPFKKKIWFNPTPTKFEHELIQKAEKHAGTPRLSPAKDQRSTDEELDKI